MLVRLLALFIIVPLVELTLLLYLADLTGWRHTLLLVIVTGVVGSLLARAQGWRTYQRIHAELEAGRMPGDSLLDAVMIFVAGALLLTPGILTDLFGLSLLIPLCRRWYRARLVRWFKSRFQVVDFTTAGGAGAPQKSQIIDSYVVERPNDDDGANQRLASPAEGRGPDAK